MVPTLPLNWAQTLASEPRLLLPPPGVRASGERPGVASTVVETPLTVTMQPAALAGDLFEYQPCLLVNRGQERIGRVFVLLTGSAKAIANARGFEDEQLGDALLRYGLGRLAAELMTTGGEERLFQGVNASLEWKIDSTDLSDLVGGDSFVKKCSYQLSLGRDLLCSAASIADETVTAEIGHRRAAPTSRPICAICNLPDSRFLCSRLIHPQVVGKDYVGTGRRRIVLQAFCDDGQPGIAQTDRCRAGGNTCWRLEIDPPAATLPPQSPLTVPEALDFLDAVWRLAFGKERRLIRPSNFGEAAGLAIGCETHAEFESRVSDLADALDKFNVPDDLLPTSTTGRALDGSLNRLAACLNHQVGVDRDAVESAVGTLQRIRGLRHTTQHSGMGDAQPRILRELGLGGLVPKWSELWDALRAQAVEALLALRTEIRRLVDPT
jgi:hypothetical protein